LRDIASSIDRNLLIPEILEQTIKFHWEGKSVIDEIDELLSSADDGFFYAVCAMKLHEFLRKMRAELSVRPEDTHNQRFIDMMDSMREELHWMQDTFLHEITSKNHPLYAVFKPKTKIEISNVLTAYWSAYWYQDGDYSNTTNMNWIDTSDIHDMGYLFSNTRFKGDISLWDVGNVRSMCSMFAWSEFNGDISMWDVSNVIDMIDMFNHSHFNGDISRWNVWNVRDVRRMFAYNTEFNGDLSGWTLIDCCNADMFINRRLPSDKCPKFEYTGKKLESGEHLWMMYKQTMHINESFKIEDIGNEMPARTNAIKQKVQKHSKEYMAVEKVINSCLDSMRNGIKMQNIAKSIVADEDACSIIMQTASFLRDGTSISEEIDEFLDKVDNDIIHVCHAVQLYRFMSRAKDLRVKDVPSYHWIYKDFGEELHAMHDEFLYEITSKEHPLYAVFKPETKDETKDVICLNWSMPSDHGCDMYRNAANLNWLDTSNITDMSWLFSNGGGKFFIGDISLWDTHNVRYMQFMFDGSEFDGDISGWDVCPMSEIWRECLSHRLSMEIFLNGNHRTSNKEASNRYSEVGDGDGDANTTSRSWMRT